MKRKPGPRQRLGPQQKPGRAITEAEILDAAVALLDTGGFAAGSIRRVAAAVGVAPNAVYTYFPDEAALERAMIERLVGKLTKPRKSPKSDLSKPGSLSGSGALSGSGLAEGLPGSGGLSGSGGLAEGPPGSGGLSGTGGVAGNGQLFQSGDRGASLEGGADNGCGWRVGVEELALDLRRLLVSHPGAVRAMLVVPVDGPSALGLGERLLDLLAAGGLDPASAARGSYVLIVYVLGAIALEVAGVPHVGALPPEAERIAARRTALAGVPLEAFPRTAAAAPVVAAWVGTEQFVWGLRRVLDGLESEGRRG